MKRFFGLQGCSKAWKIDELARESEKLLIICADSKIQENLFEDLKFFAADKQIISFKGWESLPYEQLSPPIDISADRISSIFKLNENSWDIIITSVESLIQKVLPYKLLEPISFSINEQQLISRESIIKKLNIGGYRRVSLVEEVGDYAVRGSVIDFFPSDVKSPVRIEFFDNEIERLRFFNPETQRTISSLDSLRILPVSEFIDPLAEFFTEDFLEQGISKIKSRAHELEVPPRESAKIIDALKTGRRLPGLELVQAGHLVNLEHLFEMISPKTQVILNEPIDIFRSIDIFWEMISARESKAIQNHELVPRKEDLFISPDELERSLGKFKKVQFESLRFFEAENEHAIDKIQTHTIKDLGIKIRAASGTGNAFSPLAKKIKEWRKQEYSIIFSVGSETRAERLQRIILQFDLDARIFPDKFHAHKNKIKKTPLSIFVGKLSEGAVIPDYKLVFVSEADVFSEKSSKQTASANAVKKLLTSLSQLTVDDYVVHQDYGIGIYRGLKHIEIDEAVSDFIHIEYADSQLYLPVQHIGKIHKYVATEGKKPIIDKLSSNKWQTKKRKVKEAIVALAGDLIKLYAIRNNSSGFQFTDFNLDDEDFADSFAYSETEDQLTAIKEVLEDMSSQKPMDRLVCGDVGFGKTEVAMRAAFKAVQDGKQVAILSPTTILAEQHRISFEKRFLGFPVNIAAVSRFYKTEANKSAIDKLSKGDVDIIIGTHKLLQKDIHFKDLGLLVIDEEHRFGVKQKEKLKQVKKDIDVLSLTATPIPRTLHMSLLNVRDVSLINTPPQDRRSIRTYVAIKEDGLIRDAILREIQRGGQCFFLHNRVQSIELVTAGLSELVPEAKFAFGHGQMKESELEKIMKKFLEGEIDVLVSTTIIESGIDIPNANTLIVDKAHTFGLAQLYQIRGRVGRSSKQAYAYLLIPPSKKLGKDAEERLKALQALDDLGQGFNLAMRDLEIRGAGNLLGKEQSGNVLSIGFEMYTKILKEAAANLKGEDLSVEDIIDPEVKLGIDAFIPDSYIPDVPERLVLYQRLASLRSNEETDLLIEEIVDRFGPMSKETINLVEVMRIRALLRKYGISKIEHTKGKLRIEFSSNKKIDSEKAIQHALNFPDNYKLGKNNSFTVLKIPKKNLDPFEVYKHLEDLLDSLST